MPDLELLDRGDGTVVLFTQGRKPLLVNKAELLELVMSQREVLSSEYFVEPKPDQDEGSEPQE